MLPDSLLQQTRIRFPDFARDAIEVTPLEKGGSDRKFYRIEIGDGSSLILVKYGNHREENRHYVAVAEFLTKHGVNTPRIYFHDPDEGLIWMQDLGEIDLWASRHESWEIRRPLYEKTLIQAAHLHSLTLDQANGVTLQAVFDERLYLWEQGYFFENCLGNHFHLPPDEIAALATSDALRGIARRLAEKERVLVHRDFQSQNIMIRDGDAWLIDFQGLRPGLGLYDVASLLHDPYVDLMEVEKEYLLDFYGSQSDSRDPDFEETFRFCSLQRLMQALGAYGFLGHVKGRADFLLHIPRAVDALQTIVAAIPGLSHLHDVLSRLARDAYIQPHN
ncbi:MAG TPA: phosphotransferase [Chthoniobacterales bacterium]